MSRISETELILPSLLTMSLNNRIVTTSELIVKLREILNPQGEDLAILSGRKDDKFSQKVRNLKSHTTFERYGYAKFEEELNAHKITEKGTEYLQSNLEALSYLLGNNFNIVM